MKKLFLMLGMSAMLFAGASVRGEDFVGKLMLYPANIVMDAIDIFSLNVGVGPVLRAEVAVTQACVFGGGVGLSCMLYKDYNRQYGAGVDNGWYFQFLCFGQAEQYRQGATTLVRDYQNCFSGVQFPLERNFEFPNGPRDYWRIGGALGAFGVAEFYIHPVEIADLITGLFFFDLKDDNIVSEDMR